MLGGLTIVLVLALDQLSKWIIIETIGPETPRTGVTIIPGVLEFIFVRNTGSAFGLFQNSSDVIKIAALVAVGILLIYYFRAASRDWVMSLALGLQLGGALGNIADRFRYGYVVDFINFPRFPTFNVADSAITIGVILLMFALLFRDVDGRHHAERDSESRRTVHEDA
jgi:signal peptidase II